MKSKIITSLLYKGQILIFFVIIFLACNKKPTVGFNVDKAEYSAGETISITNYSKDVKRYKWTFRNSNRILAITNDEIPSFKIPLFSNDGDYNVILDAFSRKDKKNSQMIKSFLVKTLKGTLNIYCANCTQGFTVEIDNEPGGSTSTNSFQIDLPIGARYVNVLSNSYSRTKTVNITYGQTYNLYLN